MAFQVKPPLDEILAPIADSDQGCGVDLWEVDDDDLYEKRSEIWFAQSEGRALEADPATTMEAAQNWDVVIRKAPEALAKVTKDLRIAVVFTEAVLRRHGLAGFDQGLAVLEGLFSQYFDGFHPREEDAEERLFNVIDTFGGDDLIFRIKRAPLFEARGHTVSTEQVLEAEAASQADLATYKERAAAAPDGTGVQLLADLDRMAGRLRAIDEIVTEKTQRRVDSRIYSTLTDGIGAARKAVQMLFPNAEETAAEEAGAAAEMESDAADAGQAGGEEGAPVAAAAPRRTGSVVVARPALTRQDALQALMRIAEFFEKAEPQSLIAPQIRDIVRRASIPLHDLLAEALSDAKQRQAFYQMLGMREPSAPTKEEG